MMVLSITLILVLVTRLVYVRAERRRQGDLEMCLLLASWQALNDRLLGSLKESASMLQDLNRNIASIHQYRDQLEANRDIAKRLRGLHICYVN